MIHSKINSQELLRILGLNIFAEYGLDPLVSTHYQIVEASQTMAIQLAENINKTTQDELRRLITQARENNESITTLSENISNLFSDWKTYRADRVARTETTKANSIGVHEVFKREGVQTKVWYLLEMKERETRTSKLTGRQLESMIFMLLVVQNGISRGPLRSN